VPDRDLAALGPSAPASLSPSTASSWLRGVREDKCGGGECGSESLGTCAALAFSRRLRVRPGMGEVALANAGRAIGPVRDPKR